MIFARLMRLTWRVPKGVPSGLEIVQIQHQDRKLKWLFKYLKRRFFCEVIVKFFSFVPECGLIERKHRTILWVNLAAPSLGDSLMDLSARVLLKDREVVLLTHPKNVLLYKDDCVFCAVFSDPRQVVKQFGRSSFDLVIVDSYSPRVLWNKLILAPVSPFVGLYGYLNGFEVHRTYFAFARMMELLRLDQIDEPMRPTITLPAESKGKPPEFDVCIAVGGEWSFRTYDHWPSVVSWLIAQGFSVSLVGSDNGVTSASEILKLEPTVISTVGTLSVPEVVSEIAKASVFIGADGGLWHIACGIPVPSVGLFADCQIFDSSGTRVTRETKDMNCEILYDDIQVSNIQSYSVIEAFKQLSVRIGLHTREF